MMKPFDLVQPEYGFIDGLASLLNDPLVAKWLGGPRRVEVVHKGVESWIAHWSTHSFGPWIVIDKESSEPVIGRGGIRCVELLGKLEVELFYAVRPSYWKKGIATQIIRAALEMGFRKANLPSMVAFTMPTNTASLYLIRKFGFVEETEFTYAGLPCILFRLHKSDYENARDREDV